MRVDRSYMTHVTTADWLQHSQMEQTVNSISDQIVWLSGQRRCGANAEGSPHVGSNPATIVLFVF